MDEHLEEILQCCASMIIDVRLVKTSMAKGAQVSAPKRDRVRRIARHLDEYAAALRDVQRTTQP